MNCFVHGLFYSWTVFIHEDYIHELLIHGTFCSLAVIFIDGKNEQLKYYHPAFTAILNHDMYCTIFV